MEIQSFLINFQKEIDSLETNFKKEFINQFKHKKIEVEDIRKDFILLCSLVKQKYK